jgi:GntR family transcriptional regulator
MDAASLTLQTASPEPLYRQIGEQLRRLVASGQLQAGDGLPSVREMALQHAINPMTVSRAYQQLEAEGLLARRRGVGMVVAPRPQRPPTAEERLRLLEPRLQDVIRESRELGLAPGPVCDRLHSLFLALEAERPSGR